MKNWAPKIRDKSSELLNLYRHSGRILWFLNFPHFFSVALTRQKVRDLRDHGTYRITTGNISPSQYSQFWDKFSAVEVVFLRFSWSTSAIDWKSGKSALIPIWGIVLASSGLLTACFSFITTHRWIKMGVEEECRDSCSTEGSLLLHWLQLWKR